MLIFVGLIGATYIFDEYGSKVAQRDSEYLDRLLAEKLQIGMGQAQIESAFSDFENKIGLWECVKEINQDGVCEGEKALVISIPLPSDYFWLGGRGSGQVYFYMNQSGTLIDYDYELYYPRYL